MQASFSLPTTTRGTLSLTHLTSTGANAPGGGYAPVDIYVNDFLILDDYDVAAQHNGSHDWQTDRWDIASFLKTGENTVSIVLEDKHPDSTQYWLRSLVVSSSASPPAFNPLESDLRSQLAAASIESRDIIYVRDTTATLRMLTPGFSYIKASFDLVKVPKRSTLTLSHLTSGLAGAPGGGYSPVYVYVNDQLLLDNYDVAQQHNGSHEWQTDEWEITSLLMTGRNTVNIAFSADPLTTTQYWLQSLRVLLPGDADGDGRLTATDITKVERVIAGLDAETPGADANQDGFLNALDITRTERNIAGLD
ncbi:MAG: hypothetical protein HY670_09340 [Chloroflexi bacterium]|nr:hypothetical protein [Chloroflexota bacterium]